MRFTRLLAAAFVAAAARGADEEALWPMMKGYCTGFQMEAIELAAGKGPAWERESRGNLRGLLGLSSGGCRSFQEKSNAPEFLRKFRAQLRDELDTRLPRNREEGGKILGAVQRDLNLMRRGFGVVGMRLEESECGQLLLRQQALLEQRLRDLEQAALAVGRQCSLEKFRELHPERKAPAAGSAAYRTPAGTAASGRASRSDITSRKKLP